MPSSARLVFITIKLFALSATLSVAPALLPHASASPMPFPLANAAASLSSSLAARAFPTIASRPSPQRSSHGETANEDSRSVAPRKTSSDSSEYYAKMKKHHDAARKHATNYKRHASRSSSVSDNDGSFQRECASELSGYHSSLLGIQELLRESGRDSGLAYYDRNNDLETLLKDIVNYHKDVLAATTVLFYNIPLLGPILGPIMYEIKCDVELLLDTVENISDALLNALGLSLTLRQTKKTTCLLGGGACQ